MHISDFLSRHPIENEESPHEIIPIAFQLIEQIMKIKENEKGQLIWATDYEQDVVYMSHFTYACKMRYPLNLVLESWEYLWFY